MTRKRTQRTSRRKLATAAIVVLVVAGGTVAAVTAVGQGTGKPATHVRAGGRALGARDLAAAAAYLGLPSAQVVGDLRAGKSLAQIAEATPGKSASGLVAALVTVKNKRLSKKLHMLGATVTRRVSSEVNRSGSALPVRVRGHRSGLRAGLASPERIAPVAAGYLGISPAQLERKLRSGRTLTQLANSTHGRSAAGMIGALVAARRESISAALGSHRITQVRANTMEARLMKRATAIANRKLPQELRSGP